LHLVVIAGLDPAIHHRRKSLAKRMDARVKPAHDDSTSSPHAVGSPMQTPSRTRELLVALFVLGVVLLAPPLLIIFNKATRVLGVPTLYLYLFAVWAALIALVALAVERRDSAEDVADTAAETRGSEPAQAGGSADA
jgi:hypothetical protein